MSERFIGTEEFKRLSEDIDYFNDLKIGLLPLNITKNNNSKKDFAKVLSDYGFGVDSWKHQYKTYNENIKAIKNGNIGLLIKTGDESDIIIIDFDTAKDSKYQTESKELLDLVKKRDTLMINTPSGGVHAVFKYTGKIPNCRRGIYDNIDIRSGGGCAFYGYRDDGDYSIIDKTKKIKSISPDILVYINKWVDVKKIKPFKEIKDDIDKATKENKQIVYRVNPDSLVKYNISNSSVDLLFAYLPKIYADDWTKWITMTLLCKKYDYYEIWKKWSKTSDKYNEKTNNNIWLYLNTEDVDINLNYLIFLLNSMKCHKFPMIEIIHNHYKPINTENLKRFKCIINEKYLSPHYFNGIKQNKIILIKSSLGTGKTYNMIQYAIKNRQKILSIVHLTSLCDNQISSYNKLRKEIDPDSKSHQIIAYNETMKSKYSVVSTIDSLIKTIEKIQDIGEYVVYIDEIHRIIEYMILSSTLDTKRRQTYTTFIKLLKECKGIVGTDGDINDLVFDFFDKHDIECECILNEYKSFNKIPVNFYTNDELIMNKMKNMVNASQYFTCCCNTKTRVNKIKKLLIDLGVDYNKDVRTYTRDEGETVNNVNEKWHNKYIIYSPSIVEGIDRTSKYSETVFSFYDGIMTLTPEQVKQQICRNRNIKCVNVCFTKSENEKLYNSYTECHTSFLNKKNNYKLLKNKAILKYLATSTSSTGEIINNTSDYFTELYMKTKYAHSLMNSNVKYTLKIMLEDIGFEVNDDITNDMESLKEYIPGNITPLSSSETLKQNDDEDTTEYEEDEDEDINIERVLMQCLKDEPVLPTRYKLKKTIEDKIKDYINLTKPKILEIIEDFEKEEAIRNEHIKNGTLGLIKKKMDIIDDVNARPENYNVLNHIDNIKHEIKTKGDIEKEVLKNKHNNDIEILKKDFKDYDDDIKNKWINDIIAIDETFKINKENMVLREAVKIKKEAIDIITLEKQEKKEKKQTLDLEIKNIKDILAKALINITAKCDKEIKEKLDNIKETKISKTDDEKIEDKRKRYILNKRLKEEKLIPEEEEFIYKKVYVQELKNILTKPYDFRIYLNIRTGFILTDNILITKFKKDSIDDKQVKCINKTRTLITLYRDLIRKYLKKINMFDFKFDEFIDTFGNDTIQMNHNDVSCLMDNIETKKPAPTTKKELVALLKILLTQILGDEMLVYDNHVENIKGVSVKFSNVSFDKYKFNAYIKLASNGIKPSKISEVEPYFIEKYSMSGCHKKQTIYNDDIFNSDSEDDEEGKFYGKRAIKK